jgi:arylsulfatase A-like enzyme
MLIPRRLLGLLGLCLVCAGVRAEVLAPFEEAAARDDRPNVLIIVADDMGFSDLGAFGGTEIQTPHLDDLASRGLRLANFHALPTCAPTRAVLLTGVDNHLAGIGSQLVSDAQRGQPGYEGFLNERVVTIAELLGAAGYRTYHSGKWHLGASPEYGPHARGFQESFALLPGGASHFADARPLHPAEPTVYVRNGSVVPELPADFYSTEYYTEQLLQWLQRDAASEQPFLAYLAYTAPHDPLHAPPASIAKYRGVYDEGYEVLRERRFRGLQAAGLIPASRALPPWPWYVPRWSSLTAEQKAASRRDMEIYAAMIDYMDAQVGRVLALLEAQGRLDNTLILFMSDNGANGAPAKVYPAHTRAFHATFDNSLANRGASGSFVSTGPGWATASTAAFSRFKFFLNEGGIRTLAMIKPPLPAAGAGVSHEFAHVRDIVPTVLELAGLVHPAAHNSQLALPQGRSLLPLLQGRPEELAAKRPVGYEVHGARAYIDGDWKALYQPVGLGSGQWQLFNLADDPAEQQDLGTRHPKKLAELRAAQAQYERDSGVVYSLPKPVAQAQRLFLLLLGVSGLLLVWLHLSQRPRHQARPLGWLLGLCKAALLASTFSSWRDSALVMLLLVAVLEPALYWRELGRWPLLLQRVLLLALLLATLLFANGVGIVWFLRDY